MGNYLFISDAAKEVQVESHVLRYWEEELHLPIKRNELGHRYYTEEDVERFKQIKGMKERGLQLKAIKMILKDGKLDMLIPRQKAGEEAEKSETVEKNSSADNVRDTERSIEQDMGQSTEQSIGQDMGRNAGQGMRQNTERNAEQGMRQGTERNAGQGMRQNTERNAEQGMRQGTERNAGQGMRQNMERGTKQDAVQSIKQGRMQDTAERITQGSGWNTVQAMARGRAQNTVQAAGRNIMPADMPIDIVEAKDTAVSAADSKAEKSRRLQWLLQQLIRETLQENNSDLCREIKESVVKELDYQFRMQEEREEARDKLLAERSEEHYRRMDELLRKKAKKKILRENAKEKTEPTAEKDLLDPSAEVVPGDNILGENIKEKPGKKKKRFIF